MGYKSKQRTLHTHISKEAFKEIFNIVRFLAIAIWNMQMTMQFPFTSVRMAMIKTQLTINAGNEIQHSSHVGGSVVLHSLLDINMAIYQNIGSQSISKLGYNKIGHIPRICPITSKALTKLDS